MRTRLLAICALAAVAGACGSGGASSAQSSTASPSRLPASPAATTSPRSQPDCVVGVSWNNYAEEHLDRFDAAGIKRELAKAGATYVMKNANSSQQTEAANIDELLAGGAKVLIVRPADFSNSLPAIRRALAAGVPVITYENFVQEPKALYVGYDMVASGRAMARAILAAKPAGTYAIINGSPDQDIPRQLHAGTQEVLQPAIDSGAITIADDVNTMHWDAATAFSELQSILAKTGGKVDAVIVQNDGMAGAVLAALKDAGLEGRVAVSGKDGDAAGLNRVALGTQTVDVWEDTEAMGAAAGRAALALCADPDPLKVQGAKVFSFPGQKDQPSILLSPQPVTRDNLGVVLESGWITKRYLCANVPAATAPAACR